MMRLILLRHAKAAAYAGGGDAERALTTRGRSAARDIGVWLEQAAIKPDLAVISTARRTRETWAIVADAAHYDAPVLDEQRLYLAEPPVLLELMHLTPASVHTLLCVGHNPGFHDYALEMIGTDGEALMRLERGLPTAGLVIIDFDANHWRDVQQGSGQLVAFVTPEDVA